MIYPNYVRSYDVVSIVRRVRIFVNSLRVISRRVITCMETVNNGIGGTPWGLTSLSGFVSFYL